MVARTEEVSLVSEVVSDDVPESLSSVFELESSVFELESSEFESELSEFESLLSGGVVSGLEVFEAGGAESSSLAHATITKNIKEQTEVSNEGFLCFENNEKAKNEIINIENNIKIVQALNLLIFRF